MLFSSFGAQASTQVKPQFTDTITPNMCSKADAYTVVIAWANEETDALHFTASVTHYKKGDCVNVRLVNADIETDGSYADHDFDIAAAESGISVDFHQEFNQNGTMRSFFVQMPNADQHVIAFCGITGHRAAGMYIDFWVGSATSKGSSSSPAFTLIIGLMSLTTLAVITKRFRK